MKHDHYVHNDVRTHSSRTVGNWLATRKRQWEHVVRRRGLVLNGKTQYIVTL